MAIPATVSVENLSWEELVKRRLQPLDSFVRLLDCAAANRPPEADDQFRFQWFGLIYQAPEQDAYTLRLRLPGGRLKPWLLEGLADLTQRHASGYVLCNVQGGLDVPGVPVTSAIDALALAENIGFTSLRTGGDCVQAIHGGELDSSIDQPGEHAPFYPMVCALERVCSLSPALSDLPLPCEIVFVREFEDVRPQGHPAITTIVLRHSTPAGRSAERGHAASRPPSFILHLPGDTHGFRLAPGQVVSACLDLLKSWASGADRSSREAASLGNFLAGADFDVLNALPGKTPCDLIPPGSEPGATSIQADTMKGYPAPGRRLLSGQLMTLDQCCRKNGWEEIRLLQGQLFAAGPRGEILDATNVLREVLFA